MDVESTSTSLFIYSHANMALPVEMEGGVKGGVEHRLEFLWKEIFGLFEVNLFWFSSCI